MANFNFNKVILGGRLTADPELKTTTSGISVTSFTVAVNRRSRSDEESKADFFNVTAWRQNAEFITRYFKKASSICLTGSLQNRSWTDQQGQKRFATEVVVDEVFFVDAKSQSPMSGAGFGGPDSVPSAPAYSNMPADEAPKFEEVADDDDLPF